MAVKTFTTGEVLTAADANTYLNNGGLVYITEVTVGSNVASITISNCFSTTYDNYRLIFRIDTGPGGEPIMLQLRTSTTTQTTNYKSFLQTPLDAWTTGSSVLVTATTFMIPTYGHASAISASFDLMSPFLTAPTAGYGSYATSANAGYTAAIQTNSTSFVSAVIGPAAGTISGGKISVYGYRKA